jgi:thiamine-monophosphate kinase
MKIKSELDLYRMIAKKPRHPDALVGIGDDCAVIRGSRGKYLVTTDMIVEGDHFSLDYFKPHEIGIKAMESNVSDVCAMGGKPLFAFVSVSLKPGASEKFIREFFRGLQMSCRRHRIDLLGGDTTHGSLMVVNVTLIGIMEGKQKPVLRSGARTGDLIFVTGKLGASTAGLKLFQRKLPGHAFVKRKHTQPSCRSDVSGKIAKMANAMEDVSDGLASEVRNICLASGKGAIIYGERVPIDARTRQAAAALGLSALDFALFGGEDFELVYCVPKARMREAQKYGTLVGEITGQKGKVFLEASGRLTLLRKFGYDHFAAKQQA